MSVRYFDFCNAFHRDLGVAFLLPALGKIAPIAKRQKVAGAQTYQPIIQSPCQQSLENLKKIAFNFGWREKQDAVFKALYLQCLFVAPICHHVYLLCVFASHCRLDQPSINAECCHQDLYLNLHFSKESINHVLHFYKRNDYIYATVAPHHLLHFFQRKQSSLRLPRIIFCTFSKETIFYAAAPHHQTIKDLMTSGATKFIIVAHTLKYKIWSKRQLIFELKK